MTNRSILYSFRRCPYAIRARLALAAAGIQPGSQLELREVSLRHKPAELLEASAKGTVPVLVAPPGESWVREESVAVMRWALERRDPCDWLRCGETAAAIEQRTVIEALIAENDGPFKHHLDRFKYPERYPGVDRQKQRAGALAILRRWNERLEQGGWLLGNRPSLADMALLPFVRQFRRTDAAGFDAEAELAPLQNWLRRFEASDALAVVMAPDWGPRQSWRSPRWIYHLALAEEWREAVAAADSYRRSSRGLGLEEVGFIHASSSHQIAATHRRFYADAGPVLLLTIDPARLEAPVYWESAAAAIQPQPEELFPHIYGPLPLQAVLTAEPYRPDEERPNVERPC